MRHRRSYIEALEQALTLQTDSGEVALVVIARNFIREAMDPKSPNYKFALAELNQYLLGKPEENINVNVAGTVMIEPSPSSLAMMGIGRAVVRETDQYGDLVEREVKALGTGEEEPDGG